MSKRRVAVQAEERFGALTTVRAITEPPARRWLCVCDCGKQSIAYAANLTQGRTRSCGCGRLVHGMWTTREWRAWHAARQRCFGNNKITGPYYRERGITMCPEWAESFEQFYRDMGPCSSDKHSLDRIDVNGHYHKENCRWVTAKEQALNRRNTVRITYGEVTRTIEEWSRLTGVSCKALRNRLYRGWSVEDILQTPMLPDGARRAKH